MDTWLSNLYSVQSTLLSIHYTLLSIHYTSLSNRHTLLSNLYTVLSNLYALKSVQPAQTYTEYQVQIIFIENIYIQFRKCTQCQKW